MEENKTEMLTVKDMYQRLNISRQQGYILVHRKGFPSFRVGKKILIPADKLQKWIEEGGSANERNNHQ